MTSSKLKRCRFAFLRTRRHLVYRRVFRRLPESQELSSACPSRQRAHSPCYFWQCSLPCSAHRFWESGGECDGLIQERLPTYPLTKRFGCSIRAISRHLSRSIEDTANSFIESACACYGIRSRPKMQLRMSLFAYFAKSIPFEANRLFHRGCIV